jgi:hypothetical protein
MNYSDTRSFLTGERVERRLAAILVADIVSYSRLMHRDEARAAAQAGLALDPGFNLRRYRVNALSDDPVYLAGRERSCEGMRFAGVREG